MFRLLKRSSQPLHKSSSIPAAAIWGSWFPDRYTIFGVCVPALLSSHEIRRTRLRIVRRIVHFSKVLLLIRLLLYSWQIGTISIASSATTFAASMWS